MVRILCAAVAILGAASLVFGIVFVVMGSSTRSEVTDNIKEEGFPLLATNIGTELEAYPYLTLVDPTDPNIIDTAEEIEDASNVVKACRHKMTGSPAGAEGFSNLFKESTLIPWELPVEAGGEFGYEIKTIALHEYTGLQSLESVLTIAEIGIGLSTLMTYIGIANIITGSGLMVAGGIGVFRRPA